MNTSGIEFPDIINHVFQSRCFRLQFESNDDLLAWKGALEEAIAEGLGDNSVGLHYTQPI